MPSGDDPEIS